MSTTTIHPLQKVRQSNIELLRILAMLGIIAHHFAVHGGFSFPVDVMTVNRVWVRLLQLGGKLGVNLFVLISGYFMVSAKSFKLDKLLKLFVQILTFSVGFSLLSGMLTGKTAGLKDLIFSCFPITFSQWWFASAYVMLFLLSPFLNRFLTGLDKGSYLRLLLLLSVCWSVIPTVTGRMFQSNDLLWFMYLYALAGYFRLYDPQKDYKAAKLITVSAVLCLLTFLSTVLFDALGTRIRFFANHAADVYRMQSIPLLLVAVFAFLGFLKLNIGYHKVINFISAATFGVYLIHDNRYVRTFLWDTVFQNSTYADSGLLIPYSLFAVFTVFIGCSLLELLRIHVLEKWYWPLLQKGSLFLDEKKEALFSKWFSQQQSERKTL